MNYTDEQLEEFRRKAIELRQQMGLAENLPINDRRFTPAQRDYFVACDKQEIPHKISSRIMGVDNPERVQSYIYSKSHKSRNRKLSQQKPSSNGNQPTLSTPSEERDEVEDLEKMAQSSTYSQETRDLDLVNVIKNHEALERVIVPLLDLGAYTSIVVLYGSRTTQGSERDKAISIFSTKAKDIVRKVDKLEEHKSISSGTLYNELQRMSSYARQELERFSPKKF